MTTKEIGVDTAEHARSEMARELLRETCMNSAATRVFLSVMAAAAQASGVKKIAIALAHHDQANAMHASQVQLVEQRVADLARAKADHKLSRAALGDVVLLKTRAELESDAARAETAHADAGRELRQAAEYVREAWRSEAPADEASREDGRRTVALLELASMAYATTLYAAKLAQSELAAYDLVEERQMPSERESNVVNARALFPGPALPLPGAGAAIPAALDPGRSGGLPEGMCHPGEPGAVGGRLSHLGQYPGLEELSTGGAGTVFGVGTTLGDIASAPPGDGGIRKMSAEEAAALAGDGPGHRATQAPPAFGALFVGGGRGLPWAGGEG